MDAFDSPTWNLCQAAVWIEFREKELVEKFAAPEGREPDGEAYRALHFYPKMWPPERVAHGSLNELHDRLKLNSLKARGYHASAPDRLQVIQPKDWHDIHLRPPRALDARDRRRELWSGVRVDRADVLRIWPFPTEQFDRSKFDWQELRGLYERVRAEQPNLSQRRTIEEVQDLFEKRHDRKLHAPSRTTLQNRIKKWNPVAT